MKRRKRGGCRWQTQNPQTSPRLFRQSSLVVSNAPKVIVLGQILVGSKGIASALCAMRGPYLDRLTASLGCRGPGSGRNTRERGGGVIAWPNIRKKNRMNAVRRPLPTARNHTACAGQAGRGLATATVPRGKPVGSCPPAERQTEGRPKRPANKGEKKRGHVVKWRQHGTHVAIK